MKTESRVESFLFLYLSEKKFRFNVWPGAEKSFEKLMNRKKKVDNISIESSITKNIRR